ncbi:MAG: paraquat-inducible protein A, partial [Bacteroidota bacterium]
MTNKERSAERTVAFMVASLVLYAVSISFPFMRMERSGLSNEISVIDAVGILASNSMIILAMICAGLILLFPLLRI